MKRTKVTFLSLLLALGVFVQTTTARYLPTDARALYSTRVPLLRLVNDETATVPLVEQVRAIGMTVSDMHQSVDFYSRVLSFEKISDVEVTGEDYERLQGVFGLRMRVVRMRLGDEFIELTEYLAPKIAGFNTLRSSPATWIRLTHCCVKTKWSMLLLVHSVCPIGTRTPAASGLSTFAIRTSTGSRSSNFLRTKVIRSGSGKTSYFWESTIRQLSSTIQKRA